MLRAQDLGGISKMISGKTHLHIVSIISDSSAKKWQISFAAVAKEYEHETFIVVNIIILILQTFGDQMKTCGAVAAWWAWLQGPL
jgi:hypothetical protein